MKWLIFALMLLVGCACEPDQECQELYTRHSNKINYKIRIFARQSGACEAIIHKQTTSYECENGYIVITRDFDLTWWSGTRCYTAVYRTQEKGSTIFEIEERPF